MNAGYAFLPDEDPTFFPGDYETELIHGCIPFIEQKYRVAAGRKNRAIAGLSLGSVQSFAIGMGHRDLFSRIGVFSGGFPVSRPEYDYTALLQNPEELNASLDLLFFSNGDQEPMCTSALVSIHSLQEKGARNVLVSMAGNGALLVDEHGEVHRIGCPKGKVVNSVGAGDSMVAGFVAGYLQSRSYAQALRLGTACGSATAFSLGLATKEKIDELLAQL